mmetsp:Transcript_75694/g.215485  ORF Transcript_75694/g.215485 Transcript_75694/m.215485 type:complete len:225 (-) Transcript_75694:51-725(-)
MHAPSHTVRRGDTLSSTERVLCVEVALRPLVIDHTVGKSCLDHLPRVDFRLKAIIQHEAVHVDRLLLPETKAPREGLEVIRRIPAHVHNDHTVGSHQVDTHVARLGGDQHQLGTARLCKLFDCVHPLGGLGRSVEAVVVQPLHPSRRFVVLQHGASGRGTRRRLQRLRRLRRLGRLRRLQSHSIRRATRTRTRRRRSRRSRRYPHTGRRRCRHHHATISNRSPR